MVIAPPVVRRWQHFCSQINHAHGNFGAGRKRRMPMPNSQRATLSIRPLLYIAATALLVSIFSLAQAVLVPLALAAMLGFVLVPPVAALERRGLHRLASVALVLLVALGIMAGFGYVLSRQLEDLATQMPEYQASIRTKLAALRETRKGPIAQIQDTLEKVSHELDKQENAKSPPPANQGPVTLRKDVQPVVVVPDEPSDLERLRPMLEPVLKPIATAGIVLVLVIFMLVQREDIRNRLIRLVGQGKVTITTRTMDEAGQRISTFLFNQSMINAAFGVCITAGLLVIGVPYALLWGVTAALLRFVPYVGSLLAMLMPAALALVGSEGWSPTIETVVLFLAMDGATAYLIEPVWIGTHTGVSSLALLVSAIFWTWLWGPPGLLLSTPLTVCFAVVGKHVPELWFLAVLLGDEPPLAPDVSFYQRLLAGDDDEASDILDRELSEDTREHVFDRIVVPTLLRADRDRLHERISQTEQQLVVHTIHEIIESAGLQQCAASHADAVRQRRILGVPARKASDQLALEMLGQLLGKAWALEPLSTATLASEVLLAIEDAAPDMLCITALPPGGLRHARYLCKRAHHQFPGLAIWVLRVGARSDQLKVTRQLGRDGAQNVAFSFTEATTQLSQMILESAQPEEAGSERKSA